MCCVLGYAGHDLSKEKFTELLMRTASRGPDDQRDQYGHHAAGGIQRRDPDALGHRQGS